MKSTPCTKCDYYHGKALPVHIVGAQSWFCCAPHPGGPECQPCPDYAAKAGVES